MSRECGSCSACCKVLRIEELNKPPKSRCPHQRKGGGCGIYTVRPRSCRDYVCEWLTGVGADNERPNITKVLLELHPLFGHHEKFFLQMWEVQHGALDTDYAVRVRDEYLAKGYRVSFLYFRGQNKMFFPLGAREEDIREVENSRFGFKVIRFVGAP